MNQSTIAIARKGFIVYQVQSVSELRHVFWGLELWGNGNMGWNIAPYDASFSFIVFGL
jgi:hypothetical protein